MNTFRIALVSLSLISCAAPAASALADGEGITQIAQDQAEKKVIVGFLRDRLTRHQGMTADEIIADLNAGAAQNRDSISRQNPQAATNFAKVIDGETQRLKALGDKDLILAMETARLQEAMSSDNYMLYIMNHGSPQLAYLVCSCSNPMISIIFSIFLVPFDIVALPIEFLLTAVTGF